MDNLVLLRYFETRRDAEMAVDILKQHGINSVLQERIFYNSATQGPADLFVLDSNLHEAHQILEAYFSKN
jgi:hypothetical protein